MIRGKGILVFAGLLLIAGTASAQCPHTVGIFHAPGDFLGGRASEAWCTGEPGAGNIENAMSWDGANLGTEWHIWGMTSNEPVIIADNLDMYGNGTLVYRTTYDGGQFWLGPTGPWGDGINDLTGVLTSYVVDATLTLVGGMVVGAASNISFAGDFTECPENNDCVIQFAIANAMMVWRPVDPEYWGAMPGNYPGFLCGNTGELFDACCVTVSIQCAVPNEESTWGSLKSLYQ
jgi:hypothetical protein